MPQAQRKRPRSAAAGEILIAFERPGKAPQARPAALVDISPWGVGFETTSPMVVGAPLLVWGEALPGAPTENDPRRARVMHCRVSGESSYRTGCAFEDAPPEPAHGAPPRDLEDYYEVLQLSPKADSETIQRVYRMLAQRYHPDNPDTGDSDAFQALLRAYQVLSDPEKRAAYDLQHHAARTARFKAFTSKEDPAEGVEAEKRKRGAILKALYERRKTEPQTPGLMLREMEESAQCPRDHLQFALWYLINKGWAAGPNAGRYELTINGIDAAEDYMEAERRREGAIAESRRIEASKNPSAAA